jgi:DNA-binding HxlR family transcriptional regulator
MGRTRFNHVNCGIAQSLEILGDWWTLLIVRDAFFGIRRFGDFQAHLGISRNVLSLRLRRLVDHGILDRVDVGESGERFEYRLTDKGDALLPILTTLREWGDEWVFGEGNEPLVMRDRESGRRLRPTRVCDADGRELARREIRAEAGPGADDTIRATFPADTDVKG